MQGIDAIDGNSAFCQRESDEMIDALPDLSRLLDIEPAPRLHIPSAQVFV